MNREREAWSRRQWLMASLACGALGASPRRDDPKLALIRDQATKAAMPAFEESETAHYVGIGDASERFRRDALGICEEVAADYFKLFSAKGFEPKWPEGKLPVVILAGPKSYARFEGETTDKAIGGHFDLNQNWLVMFDFRGPGANPKAAIPEQDNTLVLVHETIHQLTFNTGLLDLQADTPACISEGLATYGETWTPRTRSGLGAINVRRRKAYDEERQKGVRWIPVPRLLADDCFINEPKTEQMAYAGSWMLVSKLLKDPVRLPKFRDYLAELRTRPDPAKRIEVATRHLGDLDKLDREIRPAR
jgi:hypothetical protein